MRASVVPCPTDASQLCIFRVRVRDGPPNDALLPRRTLDEIVEEICDTIVVRNCEHDLHARDTEKDTRSPRSEVARRFRTPRTWRVDA